MTATNNIQKGDEGADRKLKELFGNKTPFKVPDGYFEELPARLLDNCRESDSKNIRPLYLKPTFRFIAAAAAILIMAALVTTMVFTNKQAESDPMTEYTLKEVYQYNLNNLAELEEAYLISLIEGDDNEYLFLIEADTSGITDDDILEYLLAENHIEYYTLYNY